MSADELTAKKPSHFIRDIIEEDLRTSKFEGRVHTRFPPEPNGYLHIGHAKAFLLSYGLAAEFGGKFNLRFDDTNPIKEEQEYVDSIKEDMAWLGVDWEDRELYASDYFEQLYEWAMRLIKKGKAYVDDLTADEIRELRGTLTEPGTNSQYRERTIEENLDLFEKMKNGEFPDGSKTLRAKIDMSSGNMNMRDPVMYRILRAHHHRTGDKWCIYPMYDWAHGQSDSIERITHSICTLEFEDHRPLYDWFLNELGEYHPRQIEFARLNLNYTVMSKRRLLELVKNKYVSGWDDPRMPTIRGMRRLGYTSEAIRDFIDRTGTAKSDAIADMALLEFCVREHLNRVTDRVMAVLRPLKVVITNYPEDKVEQLDAINNPEDESAGKRTVPFGREIYIEETDFMEDPPKKFFRLRPDGEVRLKHAYIIKCEDVLKDSAGNITEIRCSYDPDSKSGGATADRKVKGTLHWVSAPHAIGAEARLYDRLFAKENPNQVEEGGDYKDNLNPDSLEVISGALVEPSLKDAVVGKQVQFLRHGYFCVDKDSGNGRLVFNRTVGLRDSWAKIQKKG